MKFIAMNRFKIELGFENDFEAWTKSEAFRLAHKNAGSNKDLYLGHPEFEGFEVVI